MSEPTGRPAAEVVTAVAGAGGPDPEAVREALDPVTEDGRVTAGAVETAAADTAQVLATAETRAELAAIAHEDAVAAAEPVADLDAVAARLDRLTERLAEVETRVAELGDGLPEPAGLGDPGAIHGFAVAVRETAAAAQGVTQAADELAADIEAFEAWLDSPARRCEALLEDADLVAESAADLEPAVAALPDGTDAPARQWADAAMRVRTLEVLVADLRAEAADLRTWADREGAPFDGAVPTRLDDLEGTVSELRERLAARAGPAVREPFGGAVASLERDLAAVEPPVDWAAVRSTLDAHRSSLVED